MAIGGKPTGRWPGFCEGNRDLSVGFFWNISLKWSGSGSGRSSFFLCFFFLNMIDIFLVHSDMLKNISSIQFPWLDYRTSSHWRIESSKMWRSFRVARWSSFTWPAGKYPHCQLRFFLAGKILDGTFPESHVKNYGRATWCIMIQTGWLWMIYNLMIYRDYP